MKVSLLVSWTRLTAVDQSGLTVKKKRCYCLISMELEMVVVDTENFLTGCSMTDHRGPIINHHPMFAKAAARVLFHSLKVLFRVCPLRHDGGGAQ
jgi:hypothetical protein